jgi:uncharacterized 2Fe-2S/4Fe-4S cluster protein (DUF4445 family)
MRKEYSVIIIDHDNKIRESLACIEGETLLDAMTRHGISCRSDCGGRGTCGKCRIQIVRGHLDITPEDGQVLSDSELEQGIRLSCMAHPVMDCDIRLIFDNETRMDAVTADITGVNNEDIDALCIGIDLGTTTLAFALADIKTGSVIHTGSRLNSQRMYGADVISRINASNEGKREQLAKIISQDIADGIYTLLEEARIKPEKIKKAAISGNTAMLHMLMGYSCEGLGRYPFTPVTLDREVINLKDLLRGNGYDKGLPDSLNGIPVTLLPGISAFIGADIASGLMACGYANADKPCLFIDLGTNGEMALGSRNKILAASTAAGPAFEGVNISCGIGSVPGAISSIDIRDGKPSCRTINDMPPKGICGSGVCELVSELLDAGYIDSTGLLAGEYFKSGFTITGTEDTDSIITFTQKDIRQFQLAKAAIRTGIELLLSGYGIEYDQIDTVFLAGGFGFHLNALKAANVGMLVPELAGKVKAVGNSSLAGALRFLTDKEAAFEIEHIRNVTEELHLSQEERFNEMFVKYMSF